MQACTVVMQACTNFSAIFIATLVPDIFQFGKSIMFIKKKKKKKKNIDLNKDESNLCLLSYHVS